MKILVTGGAGFIGSHIVDFALEQGHAVAVIDNLSTGKLSNLNKNAQCYLLDILSTEVDTILALEKPEVVVHCAAQKSVPRSVADPVADLNINGIGMLNLLKALVRHSARKIVFLSTGGALYGDAEVLPTPETCIPKAISPYAISKHVSEEYLYFFKMKYGLDYTVLRLANVYGPRQVPEGECSVIPIFLNNILNGRPSKMFAYRDMPNGCSRDYVYCGDVVRAVLAAVEAGSGQILNIGSGIELYMRDLYEQLARLTKSSCDLQVERERDGDVRRSVLDISKAKDELNWVPQTPLRDGLLKTIHWTQATVGELAAGAMLSQESAQSIARAARAKSVWPPQFMDIGRAGGHLKDTAD